MCLYCVVLSPGMRMVLGIFRSAGYNSYVHLNLQQEYLICRANRTKKKQDTVFKDLHRGLFDGMFCMYYTYPVMGI